MSASREFSISEHKKVELFHEFMLAPAKVTPDKAAVTEQGVDGKLTTLTYRQLARLVHEYAFALDELGLDIGDRVVIESDTSGPAVAMLLACSSLGLTFIPVSPDTPLRRVMSIIESADAALHVQAADGTRDDLPPEVATGRFGPTGLVISRAPKARTRYRREVVATDAAYMIFTSGTTGRPKGVAMSHRGVIAFYRGMLAHGIITSDARVATTSPLQFDFALLDIGLALGSGATLLPVPRESVKWPRRFLGFLRESGATQVNGVPSIWRPVMRHEHNALAELTRIRGILFSGENFPIPELRRLQQALPMVRIVNCFGPTESMAFSLTDVPNPVPADLKRLSIGFAYPGAEMILIDDDGHPIDLPNVVGQIYMRGPSLFNGYWDDEEATRAALVPDPLNPRSGQKVLKSGDLAYRGEHGELYFCGRADSQVKIRGNRVELGEVERRLAEFPGIASAAAFVRQRSGQDPELSAFVVMEPGVPDFEEVALSAFCMQTMPDYMVPRDVKVLKELPVTANGKTDRAALAAAGGA
ncbi:amino acid adenylation domain-containing protein [Kibdelosporangium banguiense]|uniref:Amino acid adenylation domain-containing protein n=1 Tax=Kibdelosporangium banguiense TaxID=1365924 RepID=A0ABS4TP79_9PSEU|nr:AMP-binding protein [Kibdelosporangium banguiense]MBP2325809.1 amino acid adenylation domain-containing protein [Kibdelosporangium banguiense]